MSPLYQGRWVGYLPFPEVPGWGSSISSLGEVALPALGAWLAGEAQ